MNWGIWQIGKFLWWLYNAVIDILVMAYRHVTRQRRVEATVRNPEQFLIAAYAADQSVLALQTFEVIQVLGEEQFIERMANATDARVITPLVELLNSGDPLRSIARRCLIENLSKMDYAKTKADALIKSSAYHFIRSPRQWGQDDEALVLAILALVQSAGDSRAIPHLEQVVAMEDMSHHGHVMQAASQALNSLYDSSQSERDRRRLLRPASPRDNQVEVLVRPAQGFGDHDETRLLRPSVHDK